MITGQHALWTSAGFSLASSLCESALHPRHNQDLYLSQGNECDSSDRLFLLGRGRVKKGGNGAGNNLFGHRKWCPLFYLQGSVFCGVKSLFAALRMNIIQE